MDRSEEALRAHLGRLEAAGVDFRVAADLARDPDHDGPLIDPGPRPRRFEDLAPRPILEHDDAASGLGSDHASLSVARELRRLGDRLRDRSVLELGCGTGLLAIQAALFGARVVGTDLDERVLELARRNAAANAVTIDWRLGSICRPLREDDRFDLVVMNLPHKPAPSRGSLPIAQYGGEEGDALFAEAMCCLAGRRNPGCRVVFFLHSLPHPRLLAGLARDHDLTLRRWKLRYLAPGEYGDLVAHFRARSRAGTSYLHAEGDRLALVACVWEARLRSDGP